eukprot:1155008-Pelagomonas_calceolata.AAC.2
MGQEALTDYAKIGMPGRGLDRWGLEKMFAGCCARWRGHSNVLWDQPKKKEGAKKSPSILLE